MVKFQCAACGQKIEVNDEGVGQGICCPTCGTNIVIAPDTTVGFQSRPTETTLVIAPPAGREATAMIRDGLMPHLARWLMDRLVQTLLFQRSRLVQTQQVAAQEVTELERRLADVQQRYLDRLAAYEKRVRELERQLAAQEGRIRELQRDNLLMTRKLAGQEALSAFVPQV